MELQYVEEDRSYDKVVKEDDSKLIQHIKRDGDYYEHCLEILFSKLLNFKKDDKNLLQHVSDI